MLSQLSTDITKDLDAVVKKEYGIYFTPPTIVTQAICDVSPFMNEINDILEPSCGSGEFLLQLPSDKNIVAIELNKTICETIKDTFDATCGDFLEHDDEYDLIIGNPPFHVINRDAVPTEYLPFIIGRPNLFIVFMLHAMKLLRSNGILSFVLPLNFTNSLWYEHIRLHIRDHYTVINITQFDSPDFIDTKQNVILLTVRKEPGDNEGYFFKSAIGTKDNIAQLKTITRNSCTIESLGGHTVSVGSVVWNNERDLLTDDPGATRLVYSGDIVGNTLSLTKYKSKKNYIDKPGFDENALIVNRGYGSGTYKFKYCRVDGTYLFENHLLVIRGTKLGVIMKSFEDPRTQRFVDLYFGNNAMTATELFTIFPIFLRRL